MAQRALITGGSSGIGLAFARELAARSYDLVLCARNADKLVEAAQELRSAHGGVVEVLAADLATDEGVSAVEERLGSTSQPIDLLVNNAGFGMRGHFVTTDVKDHVRMLRVNAEAVLRLTHAALGAMVDRGEGGVLNIGSVAAFVPWVRPAATYAATKAFVITLTEGLAPTLEGTGVNIAVVCPGYVKTEFHERAGIEMSKTPKILWTDAQDVVRTALKDLESGKTVSIPGAQYKAVSAGVRYAPRGVAKRLAAMVSHRTS